ncbi:MAG: hypothetical protein WDA71_03470 [Actinomycetota bacterium]
MDPETHEEVPICVNHPKVHTRVSCSACGDPICPRCMVSTPVGQKCAKCAQLPRSARRQARATHYARALGAGAVVAVVGGLIAPSVYGVPVLGWFFPFLMGSAVGAAVHWGAHRSASRVFTVMAVALALGGLGLGLVVAGLPIWGLPRFGLSFLVAALGAFGASRGP